jgi:putative redox protein
MDAPERVGGEDLGPIPKPFVLSALSGCTGMDVVAMMRKGGHTMKSFAIDVSGEISKHAPIEYVAIHVIYEIEGDEASKQAALDAVTASQEKFCGVSHMLKKILPLTWEIHFNGSSIFNNKEEIILSNN